MTRSPPRPLELARLAIVAFFFLAAPTAGDIGSSCQSADDLSAEKFFAAKQDLDCRQCEICKLDTAPCKAACGKPTTATFPTGCYPVEHDGEVCLDALQVASCADYRGFMADTGSTVPTECDFCPPRAP